MRVHYLLTAALLPLASAELEEQHFTINYGNNEGIDLLRSVASASRANDPEVTALVDKLNEFRNKPFPKHEESPYEIVCETSAYFDAEIYPLNPNDLHPQIAWAGAEIEALFTGQPYPGDYNMPKHADGFRIVRADYATLPQTVREWIESHPEQKSFCVVDGVSFFAPAVFLEMLGLFAGEGEGVCKGQFSTDPEAYLSHGDEDVIFTAKLLGSSEVGSALRIQAGAQKHLKKEEEGEKSEKDEL